MSGQATQVFTGYDVKERSTDDALAAFLGKGNVEKGHIPPPTRGRFRRQRNRAAAATSSASRRMVVFPM
jgi:hypothetical protein